MMMISTLQKQPTLPPARTRRKADYKAGYVANMNKRLCYLLPGSYANITMPLLQTKHHRAKRLRIVESENVIFEGTVDRDSMDLPHAPLPGLDSLSFNFESYTLDFIVSSGKFNFSLSQQPVSN